MSTEHVLEAIDGALADWALSKDAMRWSPEPEDAPPLAWQMTGEQRAEIQDAMRRVGVTIQSFADRYVAAFNHLAPKLRELGALLGEPPRDPRERALWLRRHRNTGPAHDWRAS